MKQIIPQNDLVLCICITNNKKTTESGFIYESNDISLYEIVKISKNAKNDIDLNEGDIIRVNSTGTSITLDGVDYLMFKMENIVGKVI